MVFEILEPVARVRNRHVGQLRDVVLVDLDRQRLGLEAGAVADLARRIDLEARQFLTHPIAVGLAEAALQIRQHALERAFALEAAALVLIAHADRLVAGAEQDRLPGLFRQIPERRVEREAEMTGQPLEGLDHIDRRHRVPRHDRAFAQAFAVVRHHQIIREMHGDAQAVAMGTGAERIVEGEQARFNFINSETGDRAGEFGREEGLLATIDHLADRQPVAQIERCLETVGQALGDALLHDDAVYHHLDIMLQLLVQRRHLVEGVDGAVDFHTLEALALQLRQFLAIFALATAHHRCQQQQARAFGQGQDLVHHLRDGLAFDGKTGRRRMRHADAGEQQTQIIVDLGDRAHRRARILRGGLLLDGNGRGQALDQIDIGLAHQFQELAGVGRQRFDIAALAFGIDGVEGQGRFARSRQAGDHHQLVARNVDIDILEIMLARAANT